MKTFIRGKIKSPNGGKQNIYSIQWSLKRNTA